MQCYMRLYVCSVAAALRCLSILNRVPAGYVDALKYSVTIIVIKYIKSLIITIIMVKLIIILLMPTVSIS